MFMNNKFSITKDKLSINRMLKLKQNAYCLYMHAMCLVHTCTCIWLSGIDNVLVCVCIELNSFVVFLCGVIC